MLDYVIHIPIIISDTPNLYIYVCIYKLFFDV